jgi:hypothetical protein
LSFDGNFFAPKAWASVSWPSDDRDCPQVHDAAAVVGDRIGSTTCALSTCCRLGER